MINEVTPENAAAAARDLLSDRIAIIEKMAGAASRLSRAQQALAEAEQEYSSLWADAERAGWSAAELRKVGLAEPGRKRPGRPRKTAVKKSGSAEQTEAP